MIMWIEILWITICCLWAKKSFIKVGLFVTIIADYFLIFTDLFLVGVLLFCLAQYLYRSEMKQSLKNNIGKPVILGIVVGTILFFIMERLQSFQLLNIRIETPLILIIAACIYLVISVSNIRFAYDLIKEKKSDDSSKERHYKESKCTIIKVNITKNELLLVGITFLFLCDINVGLYNGLSINIFYILMWIFYIPSQLLIAVSTRIMI